MATHIPFNRVLSLQNQLKPYTSYTVALQLDDLTFPQGLFWDTEEPYHYVRRVTDSDRQLLLVGGMDHPTGEVRNTDKNFDMLEAYARKNFAVRSVEYRGSGQVFVAADGLPYIGQMPGMTNVQMATGFSGTGLTFGTIAGMLMADAILERPNAWRELYRPSRMKSAASANVPTGEGRVVEIDGEELALYRDQRGVLHAFSAACMHMGCIVQWNKAAQSWDCPCHGGRYRPTGEVLCAPPTQALRQWSSATVVQLERRIS
jgi:nitrite reductase/ring-hydroxylating ferredoxin subunit